jgi:hypothetical protein
MNYVAQRIVRRPGARNAIAKAVAITKPRCARAAEGVSLRASEELSMAGIFFLSNLLTSEQCLEVREYLEPLTMVDPRNPFGEFTLDTVPPGCHIGQYRESEMLACPYLLDIANDPRLVDAASAYLGCKPVISTFRAWWSFGGFTEPKDAEYFHRDVDDWKFVKLFVYLTDVGPDNGPHVFVKGSQRSNRLLELRRHSDAEVEDVFGKDAVLSITGAQGSAFFEDTFGFHKGTVCRTGRRLLFQVQYSISPIHAYEYRPVPGTGLDARYDAYMNRLLFR